MMLEIWDLPPGPCGVTRYLRTGTVTCVVLNHTRLSWKDGPVLYLLKLYYQQVRKQADITKHGKDPNMETVTISTSYAP